MDSYKTETDVVLTEDEKQYILLDALGKKIAKWREREHWKRVQMGDEPPILNWEGLLNGVIRKFERETGLNWVMTNDLLPIMQQLSKYFTDDPDGKLDPKKGILLYGGVGCGKTTIMRMFMDNPKASYSVFSCRVVASDFARDSFEGLDKYYGLCRRGVNVFRHSKFGQCFDDIGTESSVKNFGNQANVMEDVILTRYEKFRTMQYYTHLTTNLSAADLKSTYGERCTSRMREMFNMIDFSGIQDFRK